MAIALGVMALVATAGTAKAASVTPTQHDGNPTCKTLLAPEPAFEIKVDPPTSGSYGPITVTFSPDGKLVDFTSTVPVLAVFVKGGNQGGNLYDYRPGSSSGDTGLTTPTNQQISHVSFCWNEEPTPPDEALKVTKTAEATYDRKIDWTLKKTVNPANHSGSAGQTAGTSEWSVVATKNEELSGFNVTGVITIKNPNTQAVNFSVTDKLNDPEGTMADVDCDPNTIGDQATGTVPAKVGTTDGTATCNYTASPTTKEATSNNVQVSATGVPGNTALAEVTWQENVIGDEEVTLADERPVFNYSQTITETTPLTESEEFTCPSDPSKYSDGKHQFTETNTATLKGTNTDLSADAKVTVDCTLATLTAKKTANASFDRNITWKLTKTVTPPGPFSGEAGQSFNYTWNVNATKEVVEDNHKVTGKITISNPAAIAQDFSVTDVLDDGTVASVDCDPNTIGDQATGTVPAKVGTTDGTATCDYTALPTTKDAKENTATVKAEGNKDVPATAPVSYTANVIGDQSVTLGDTSPSDTPPINYSKVISDSTPLTFDRTFTCPTDPTKYKNLLFTQTNTNTATLKGVKTNLSADAKVTFNCKYPWVGETATGAGTKYPGTSNWFMYTPYQTTKVDLIAGQNYDAGDINMTRDATKTYITITLHNGFRFANVKENLKIQDFANAPTKYLEPGQFKYKFTLPQSTVTYTATIPGTTAKFYGIHASVERKVN